MKIGHAREEVDVSSLQLPPCALPRPGDIVVWFQNGVQLRGRLIGHAPDGAPCIVTESRVELRPPSFDVIRLDDPLAPLGPNWMRLPPTALVSRPRAEEESVLRDLLSESVPPGVTHMQLVREIWSRGYEVFVTGAAVRDVIAGFPPVNVDLVTTMPIDRLHRLAFAMYGRPPGLCDLDRFAGSLRLGGTLGSPDPFLEIRVFQYNMPGTAEALFSAEFEREAGHRDFSCNCIYYDPVNNVFIDPTGQGLEDAATTCVRAVFDRGLVSGDQLGKMSLHLLAMMARGFSAAGGQDEQIQLLLRAVAGLTSVELTTRMRVDILEPLNPELREETYERLHQLFVDIGVESVWLKSIDPYRAELLA